MSASQTRLHAFGGSCAVIGAMALVGPQALAGTEGPAMQIEWSVNGGEMNQVAVGGLAVGSSFEYSGEAVDPGTGLVLLFDLESDGSSYLSGNVSITNEMADTIEVFARAVLPESPTLPGGTELHGTINVGLTTGRGGGALGSFAPWLWQGLIDDDYVGNVASLFYHPFEVTHGGMASSSTLDHFGVPNPVDGPPLFDSTGFEVHFWLTSFDVASIAGEYGVEGCPSDVDGSGVVGPADLSAVLASWGSCAELPDPCAPDFDHSGQVDVVDLLFLLTHWGPCP